METKQGAVHPPIIGHINTLYRRACAGDADAQAELIVAAMPMVEAKVASYVNQHRKLAHLRDDLLSAGLLGIVEAVPTMCRDTNIAKPYGYLAAAVSNAFGQLIENEVLVYYSRFTFYRSRGTSRVLPHQDDLYEPTDDGNRLDTNLMDLHEVLLTCCTTERECDFVRLRMDGFDVNEIADKLGVSRRSIHRLARQLRERFAKKLEELGGNV